MNNPYETPNSKLIEDNSIAGHTKSFAWVFVCFTVYEVLAWFIVPILNGMIANGLGFTGLDYWTLRLTFDLIDSLLVFITCVVVFSRISGRSPKLLAITTASIALAAFLIELGDLDCIGSCGFPLWYDLAGFVKYPIFAVLAIFAAKTFSKSTQPALQGGVADSQP